MKLSIFALLDNSEQKMKNSRALIFRFETPVYNVQDSFQYFTLFFFTLSLTLSKMSKMT